MDNQGESINSILHPQSYFSLSQTSHWKKESWMNISKPDTPPPNFSIAHASSIGINPTSPTTILFQDFDRNRRMHSTSTPS